MILLSECTLEITTVLDELMNPSLMNCDVSLYINQVIYSINVIVINNSY